VALAGVAAMQETLSLDIGELGEGEEDVPSVIFKGLGMEPANDLGRILFHLIGEVEAIEDDDCRRAGHPFVERTGHAAPVCLMRIEFADADWRGATGQKDGQQEGEMDETVRSCWHQEKNRLIASQLSWRESRA
jgi:hypothetical protein